MAFNFCLMSEDYVETVSETMKTLSKQHSIVITVIDSYQFSYIQVSINRFQGYV